MKLLDPWSTDMCTPQKSVMLAVARPCTWWPCPLCAVRWLSLESLIHIELEQAAMTSWKLDCRMLAWPVLAANLV